MSDPRIGSALPTTAPPSPALLASGGLADAKTPAQIAGYIANTIAHTIFALELHGAKPFVRPTPFAVTYALPHAFGGLAPNHAYGIAPDLTIIDTAAGTFSRDAAAENARHTLLYRESEVIRKEDNYRTLAASYTDARLAEAITRSQQVAGQNFVATVGVDVVARREAIEAANTVKFLQDIQTIRAAVKAGYRPGQEPTEKDIAFQANLEYAARSGALPSPPRPAYRDPRFYDIRHYGSGPLTLAAEGATRRETAPPDPFAEPPPDPPAQEGSGLDLLASKFRAGMGLRIIAAKLSTDP